MDTVEKEPRCGHVWTNRKTGRWAFITQDSDSVLYYRYYIAQNEFEKKTFARPLRAFKKKFRFSHVVIQRNHRKSENDANNAG